jgi:hypothetical protein
MDSRTDLLKRAIDDELEAQRPALDAGSPVSGVSVFIHLHPSGDIRSTKIRIDQQREARDRSGRRLLGGHPWEDQ